MNLKLDEKIRKTMYDLNGPFTEAHHAFLVGSYYKAFKNTLGEEGIKIFEFATFKYAEQRGTRMAFRALQDGKPLDILSYLAYGEWQTTDEQSFDMKTLSTNPDYEIKNFRCPWHSQFKKMGLLECGKVYCKHLDEAIVIGFNPRMKLELRENLYNEDNCHFFFKDANLTPEKLEELEQMILELGTSKNLSFEYHCAHIFMTFANIIRYRLGDKAEDLILAVLDQFKTEYGQEMVDALLRYQGMNFNELPS